jgi:hypothetical protein
VTGDELKRHTACVKALRQKYALVAAKVRAYGDGLGADRLRQYLAALGARIETLEATAKRRHLEAEREAQAQQRYGLPVDTIDGRAAIRRSKAYEATTGPPRNGTKNENGPELEGSRGRISSSLCNRFPTARTAKLTRTAEISNLENFESGELRPTSGAATAVRPPHTGSIADDDTESRH